MTAQSMTVTVPAKNKENALVEARSHINNWEGSWDIPGEPKRTNIMWHGIKGMYLWKVEAERQPEPLQQDVLIFGSPKAWGSIRINRADEGDARVVFSVAEREERTGPAVYHPGIVGLTLSEARAFAQGILSAADVIEGVTR